MTHNDFRDLRYEYSLRVALQRLCGLGACFSSSRIEADVWVFCEDDRFDLRNSREHGWAQSDPHLNLPEFEPESADILILPGGVSWTKGEVPEVSKAAQTMVALSRPVAAICAATLALAYAGLLDEHSHTSNGRGFIGNTFPSIAAKGYTKHLHQSAIDL